MDYESVIGLEVHAELNTKSKVYCSCKNSFGGVVNSQVCPVCLGYPGTLPTLNEKVVEYAIKMGHALNCSINKICKQDRKNYFYPDLTKSYQISQFDIPLCGSGYLDVIIDDKVKRIGVTRIHIEEDAGKLIHLESSDSSLVDYNRCGVPLIEIVSEPDMRSSQEAKAYLETIKSILQYLDISDCKMQEGSIRCDVNVSVRPVGSDELGTRTEMKNVNSFSGAQRAIDYEIARQIEVIEAGGSITQETRRWDDIKGENFILRSKEDAHDYRYFPEPDLPPIVVSEEKVNELKKEIPELPNVKTLRYAKEYGLPYFESSLLCETPDKARFFEDTVNLCVEYPKTVCNWILGDVTRVMHERNLEIKDISLKPENLAKMIKLIENGVISNTAGKTVLEAMFDSESEPDAIIDEKGLAQINSGDELREIIIRVISENQKALDDYKNGKTNVLGYLVGQCMRETKGKANPSMVKDIIEEII